MCNEVAPGTDFYHSANDWWLKNESITIPPEYPRWGSFMILHDQSLKDQIKLLQEVAGAADSPSSKKLGLVWHASNKRFEDWENGKGDYNAILDELAAVKTTLSANGQDDWVKGLAKYLVRAGKAGIRGPFVFDKEGNLEETNNILLDFAPSGLSLPSRDYYLEDNFAEQRKQFRDHLDNVAKLLPAGTLQDSFMERVVRFETKLAQISMKKEQSRLYDQYYTITSLDDFVNNINELRHLQDKVSNYANHNADEGADKACLTEADVSVDDEEKQLIRAFMEAMYEGLDLRKIMQENIDKNYPELSQEEREQRVNAMMVFDGDYFRRVFKLLFNPENRGDVAAFLQYKVILFAHTLCTKDLDQEFFDFYDRKLRGQKEQKPPEKRSINVVNSWVGELLGKVYVERHFSEDDKLTVKGLIDDVLDVMKASLKNNDWLTDKTKKIALEKLSNFVVKIGYPDKWKNFDLLELEEGDSLFVMYQKVNSFKQRVDLFDKINSKKDHTEWEMTPQTVNAYFHPMNNEIVFPAAILQPPFYQKSTDDVQLAIDDAAKKDPHVLAAINFGAIGAVIAHEITHGYDDQGRKFDPNGNLRDWWQPEDATLFSAKAALMAKQAEVWVFDDPDAAKAVKEEGAKAHKMNPQLTMGENLADLGGMSLASQAMMRRLNSQQAGAELRQVCCRAFFLSWANVWKCKATREYLINQLATDPHAPASFRANLVKNVDSFYEAFGVKEGDPMYLAPEERVRMW